MSSPDEAEHETENHRTERKRKHSVDISDGKYDSSSRFEKRHKHKHKHHKHHHRRHSHSNEHRQRHKKSRHKHHHRHKHESLSRQRIQSRSRSRSRDKDEGADINTEGGNVSRVGELRPTDIPEDLDFSDDDNNSFPLSKETGLFVDAVFPDARVQVEDKSRNGGILNRENVTKCTYKSLENDSDAVDRKDKIIIELKRSTGKSKKQSIEMSSTREVTPRESTGIGAWMFTSTRDRSDIKHRERSTRTKTSSRDKHSSTKKQKQSQTASHERRKSLASIIQVGGKTVDEYTKMCQDIAAGTYRSPFTANESLRNPYNVLDAPDMTEIMKQIRHRVGIELGISSSLDEVFPVSCGYDHRAHEGIDLTKTGITSSVPAELGHLVISRFQAEMRLLSNPNNMEARQILWQVEQKLIEWHRSHRGKHYSGQKVTFLSAEELNSGKQAWARPDMLSNLNPVKSDFGEKVMSKMGWRQGEGLGKSNPGNVDPLILRVKTDRKGLATEDEQTSKKAKIPIIHEVGGKHPVSLLMELCAQKKLNPPDFETALDGGPAHRKVFRYKVKLGGREFEAPVVSNSKKQAKALAAMAALEGLGVIKPQGNAGVST